MKRSPLTRRARTRQRARLSRYSAIRQVSKRKHRERRKAQPVIDAVMARDGGCVLRTRADVAGECFGPLTPHHLRKQWKGPGWTLDNLVALCTSHNDWVEREPRRAWGLGLVVKKGETTALAWQVMRTAGLAVGELVLRCPGSLTPPDSLRLVHEGRCACMACGRTVSVGHGVLAEHDRTVADIYTLYAPPMAAVLPLVTGWAAKP